MLRIVVALMALAGCGQATAGLNEVERRGKRIYVTGKTQAGRDITAAVGAGRTEVPASALPCVSCHGEDGRGRPEGGVRPSVLVWDSLTKPYGIASATGRRSPAYDEASLARAIRTGVDPAGNPLLPAMPAYDIAPADMDDLVAYMKRLGSEPAPGLSENAVRIAMPVTAAGAGLDAARAIQTALVAYFGEINRQGGVHGRAIELRTLETGGVETVRGLLRDQVFALIAGLPGSAGDAFRAVVESEEAPWIGPLAHGPSDGTPDRHTFYLLPGLREQARALARFRAESGGRGSVVTVVYADAEPFRQLADAIEEQCRKSGCGTVTKRPYPPGRFSTGDLAADAVFLAGPASDAQSLVAEAAARNSRPAVFLAGSAPSARLVDGAPDFRGSLYFAAPVAPPDGSLAQRYTGAQITALAAAHVLVEGLRRAGRDVTRDKLIRAMEGFYEYETGLAPPLTFGPNRRVGAKGCYVASVDFEKREFVLAGGWVGVD